MPLIKRVFFVLTVLLPLFQDASGQATQSPFTNLTIGEAYGSALANTQGTAGAGVAQPQFWFLNNQNPALLVYNRLTVFQGGILGEIRTISADTASEHNAGGNLNYLVTAFPVVFNKWTTSVGLMPYTNLRYKLEYIGFVQNSNDSISVKEEGTGGLTQLYWANGIRLHKNIAIGAKAAYIFSSVVNTYENRLISSEQPVNYPVSIEEKLYVRDFAFTAGISYSKDSLFRQGRYRLSVGAVYDFEADLSGQQRHRFYRTNAGGAVLDGDTLLSNEAGVLIPHAITAGVAIGREGKWTLAAEGRMQDWSTFRNTVGTNDDLGKSWRLSLGWDFIPDINSGNFFKLIQYRAGLSFEQLPFRSTTNPDPVRDVGINFGFSLPAGSSPAMGGKTSSVDVAFKLGRRGSVSKNVFEENYFKIYFGVTFNDRWFIKRRFN